MLEDRHSGLLKRILPPIAILVLLGVATWAFVTFRSVPTHLEANGFTFDVWYPPDDLELFRAYPTIQAGSFVLQFQSESDPKELLEAFDVTPQGIVNTARFPSPRAKGEHPKVAWPDGSVLISTYYGEKLPSGKYRQWIAESSAKRAAEHPDGGYSPFYFQLVTSRKRPPGQVMYWDGWVVALYPDSVDNPTRWFVAGADDGILSFKEETVPGLFACGRAIRLKVIQTLAVLNDHNELLSFDTLSSKFVRQDVSKELIDALRRSVAKNSQFLLADGFALCYSVNGTKLLVDGEGNTHRIPEISPILQRPDGSPRNYVIRNTRMKLALLGIGKLDLDPPDIEELDRQWIAEGRRVRADTTSDNFVTPLLIDEKTIALVDIQYRRVILIHRASKSKQGNPG